MSVVGFDIGNDNCVIAIAKPKAIQILQNDVSKYETPSVVSFTKDRRQIGSAGASSAGMYPMSTISQIKRLIGQNYDDTGMADEFKLLPFRTTRGADGGILIEINYSNKTEVFTPVEILAMLLTHLKQMTERSDDGASVVDCVIGIPSYFNDLQRVAYLNAADIAGLNPLRLIHDGTATAIGYGYYNTDIDKPTNVIFVDVGHCDTQVTLAQFDNKKVTILTHSFDRNLGGRNFDRILYNYFAEKFKEDYKIDIDVDDKNSHHKARVRLMAACEKAKKVLTANREANINVDCLVDDKDLVGSIKREDFENLSKDLLRRVRQTCEDAFMDLGWKLTKSDIHFVELVGSGSRIPAIGTLIDNFFDKPTNRTLNGSECVARGCALQGVILLSNNNRGYAYEVQDSIPISIGFTLRKKSNESIHNRPPHGRSRDESWNSKRSVKKRNLSTSELSTTEGDERSVVFQKCQHFPCVLDHNIPDASQDFTLSSFYKYQSAFSPNASQRSRNFKVAPRMDGNLPCPVTVKICINLHGIVDVQSAKIEKQGIYVPLLSTGKYLDDIEIFETSHIGMTQKSINSAKEREKHLLQYDALVEAVQHKKNALETFIYDTRNKLKNRYSKFAKVTEKERISQNLDDAEALINEEGDHGIDTYTKSLQALQQLVNPIESRCKHFEACTEAMKKLEDAVINQKTLVKSYCICSEDLLSALQKLLQTLPKNIEQLPVLLEKIKKITDMTDENNHLVKDVSTIKEKYANLFREAIRESLSSRHAEKSKHPVHVLEEGDKVEEARGQAVARLLYTIFDYRAEMIYLTCFVNTGNKEFDNLLHMVITTCNDIEKRCEEMNLEDIPLDDIKSMQTNLDGLRQEIQQCVVLVEAQLQASNDSDKQHRHGPSSKEATVIHAAEDEIGDLEKQIFGRYRYFLMLGEAESIGRIINNLNQQKALGKRLQFKPQFTSTVNFIKKRYQECKNERVQAVGEFYECIFEIRLTTITMPNSAIKSEVQKRCDTAEKWLNQTFPSPCSSWMVSDSKMWSSDIRMEMEKLKTVCERLIQEPGAEKQIRNQEKSEPVNSKATLVTEKATFSHHLRFF